MLPSSKLTPKVEQLLRKQFPSIRGIKDPSAVKPYDSLITLGDADYRNSKSMLCKTHIALFVTNVLARTSPVGCGNTTLITSEPNPESIKKEIEKRFDLERIAYILPASSEAETSSTIKQLYPFFLYSGSGEESVFRELRSIYLRKEVDAIFVPGSHSAFNSKNVITALESIYRNRLLAISTSRSLIGKGAVLVIYVEFDDVFEKLVTLLANVDGVVPAGVFHPRYSVFYDKNLAKVLGMEDIGE